MKTFLDENFLLQNKTAEKLYHEYAALMPIIDYHNHLSPQQVADDINFKNLSAAWLYGDHYKWRAMRTNGVEERLITGKASDKEKMQAWGATVPYTMRNPLYHWTHLELQRYFDIKELLNENTAAAIDEAASAKLQSKEYSVQHLLHRMNVQLICTTDDPIDSLQYHQHMQKQTTSLKMLPAFRPDKAMEVSDPVKFNQYLDALEAASKVSITHFSDYLIALEKRHDFFAANHCSVSDHGLEFIYAEDYTEEELIKIFNSIRSGDMITLEEQAKFKSAMLIYFAELDYEKGWVQQFHLGAMRNNNSRMMQQLGADTGWDSIGDFSQAAALAKFLNRLDQKNMLAKTIIYNLNPADNEMMASMIGNFNDGSVAGKIQWGSAWWFLDQKEGMVKQLNALSNMGLISRFIGMLTDSRSFLSFPRHEYFRRILCNLFGEEIENGELPNDINWIGKMIQDICYHNANRYFNFQLP